MARAHVRRRGDFRLSLLARALAATAILAPAAAQADDAPAPQDFAVHGQVTLTDQGNLAFPSPYAGANSLPGIAEGRETFDATLFIGVRPWSGAEIWAGPEIDQGFGLQDTLGIAGFPSGEAYKVGRNNPYLRFDRLFLRQTIDLGGASSKVDPGQMQLAGSQTENRLVFTVGRFAVTDIFDGNAYAHDPRHDFLNWTLIDAGTFDYAADAWGYTVGAAAEWYQGPWTWRAGVFDLSNVPNSEKLDPNMSQFQLVAEVERRYSLAGKNGAAVVTGFLTRGRMALFSDAVALGEAEGETPNVADVRQYRSRPGVSLDLQQDLGGGFGAFARAGWADGHTEPYEFTDVDETISGGLSINGKRWGRNDDTIGLAGVVNGISKDHQAYLAAGGLGILVGDGRLPHYGTENILETYYDIALKAFLHLTVDYQFVDHPAYNPDRGPVHVFAARLHAQF
jgi:high affinity Mn2+ porin